MGRGGRPWRPRLGKPNRRQPICTREGCGHPALRHYTLRDGSTGCMANQVWPHTDPETGERVLWAHCGCPKFL